MMIYLEWFERNFEFAPNQNGVERTARCPRPEQHKNGDKNHAFRFNVTEGVGLCFACGLKGNAFQLAQQFGFSTPPDKNGGNLNRIPDNITTGEKRFHYYDENDQNRVLRFTKFRTPEKDFCVYGPDGTPGLKGKEPILYNLPNVSKSATSWIVEGESDVISLKDLGTIGTTNPFGAEEWRDSYSETLKDKGLYICGDQDEPGRRHVEKVAASNSKFNHPFLKIVQLPDVGKKGGDISDFLESFDTREEKRKALRELEAGAKDWVDPVVTLEAQTCHRTDWGNARRLVDRHGEDLRQVSNIGWHCWTGRRFLFDDSGEVERRMKETVRAIYTEGIGTPDRDERKKLISHALASEAAYKLRAAVTLAETEREVVVKPSDLDQNGDLLNVSNGTLDLRTPELREHQREDLITKLAPVEYDPTATAPNFCNFLDRIFQGNVDLIGFVRRSIGYFLTGDTSEQCFFIWYGTGANGKSTLLRIVRALLGDYCRHTDAETLLIKRNSTVSNDLARLKGARLVTASESEQGRRLAESLIKQMTGGEPLSVRFLHREYFEFVPTFKVVLVTNHKPVIRGGEHAIWRRVHLVPFEEEIPEPEQDHNLAEQIIEDELSGVLNFALHGLEEQREVGLKVPEKVRQATFKYRQELDVLGAFLAECCRIDEQAGTSASDLYASFKTWSEVNGEYKWSQQLFGRLLTQRGFISDRETSGENKGRKLWKGLDLTRTE